MLRKGQLNSNFHFMFLIFHLRKYFMNSGIGFRDVYGHCGFYISWAEV